MNAIDKSFKPLARWHSGLEEWVLTTTPPVYGSDFVTVRRHDGSTHHAAWDCLFAEGPESLNSRPRPISNTP